MNITMGILKGIKKLFKPSKKDIECAIDEDIVDCEGEDFNYVGVPAPILNPLDEWFSSPYGSAPAITQKQKDYMVQETEIKQSQDEPEDIHQLMYDMATKSGKTTIQLDSDDSWNSGIRH